MTTKTSAIIAAVVALATLPLAAQNAPSPMEARLREQVRALTMQARTLQTEKDALQADKIRLEDEGKKLTATIERVTKEQEAAKKTSEDAIAKLKTELTDREAALAQTKKELVDATNFGTKTMEMLKKTESERSKFQSESIQLKRVVADQRMKNAKMFEISSEVLTRYEKFGLGTALTAREPFVGITRARLETMIEEYGGKLAEQRIQTVGSVPGTEGSGSGKPKQSGPSGGAGQRPKD